MNEKKAIKQIGLAKVIVLNDSDILNGDKHAYTNVLGLAKNRSEFRNEVVHKLHSMDLKLIRLEGTEPLNVRRNKFKVPTEILKIAKRLSFETNRIEFSTFHTYSKD